MLQRYNFTVKQFHSHERENNICKLLYVLYITRKETRFRHKNKNSCWYNMSLVIMDIQETGTFISDFFVLKKTKIKDKILSEMCDRDKYCTFCYLFWKNILGELNLHIQTDFLLMHYSQERMYMRFYLFFISEFR